jgi:hypothetical protein
MCRPRSISLHSRRWISFLLVSLLLLLAACSTTADTSPNGPTSGTGNSGGPSGGSSTAAAISTASGSSPTSTPAAPAPSHAFAWSQLDHASPPTPQIWASINGGAPRQITHLPPVTTDCDTQGLWGLPVFSPDLSHIVASIGSANCGDGPLSGPIDTIAVASGAITPIPTTNASDLSSERTAGWLDNHTVYFVNSSGLYTYALGAGSPVLVSALASPWEAALRGSTLFWMQMSYSSSTNNWSTSLHRYDMSTHTALPGSISLGQVHECACSPGDFHLQGWDASPDGSHVVYQVTTPLTGDTFGIASSHIYYASADGSGATQIARYMSTNQPVRMQISPNGHLVAFTDAPPTPDILTASVSSPGNAGDPNFHTYSPDAGGYPVWKWDSSSFWACNRDNDGAGGPGTAIYYYTVGTTGGTVGVNGGFNPWYTISG